MSDDGGSERWDARKIAADLNADRTGKTEEVNLTADHPQAGKLLLGHVGDDWSMGQVHEVRRGPVPDLGRGVMIMGEVFAHGADQYGADNWKGCDDPRRYIGSALRHLLQFASGEVDDDGEGGSGLNHLGHAAASIAILWDITKGKVDGG